MSGRPRAARQASSGRARARNTADPADSVTDQDAREGWRVEQLERSRALTVRACTASDVAEVVLAPSNRVDLGKLAGSSRVRKLEELDRRLVETGRSLLTSLDDMLEQPAIWESM